MTQFRLVVQIGRNAPSLAYSLATFSKKVSKVIFLGDEQSIDGPDYNRVKAWLSNGWSNLYGLSSDERNVFSLPVLSNDYSTLEMEIPTQDILQQKDFDNFFNGDGNDMFDIRPGAKLVSYMMTKEATSLDRAGRKIAWLVYTDPHSFEVINVRSGEIIGEAPIDRMSLNDYLWLSHHGPATYDAPPLIELNETILEQLYSSFQFDFTDCEKGEWRNSLYKSLCNMLVELDENTKYRAENNRLSRRERADIIEKATAAISNTILQGDWGLNVKKFSPTRDERKKRLVDAERGDYIREEKKRLKRTGKSIPSNNQLTKQWCKIKEPYDPARLIKKAHRHEIDSVGYVDGRLILISCKDVFNSDTIEAEIGEMKSRLRDQFNSPDGVVIIVTGIPMGEEFENIAEELEVLTCSITKLPTILRSLN